MILQCMFCKEITQCVLFIQTYIYYKYISNWHVFFKQEHKVWALQEGKELV